MKNIILIAVTATSIAVVCNVVFFEVHTKKYIKAVDSDVANLELNCGKLEQQLIQLSSITKIQDEFLSYALREEMGKKDFAKIQKEYIDARNQISKSK